MPPFTTLNTRWGDSIRQPSREDMAQALHEIFHEDLPNVSEEDYVEHPSAELALEFDGDEGPFTTLDVFRGGLTFLTEASGRNADPNRQMRLDRLTEEDALQLFEALSAGRMDEILKRPWKPI